jgi:hypothetical protein
MPEGRFNIPLGTLWLYICYAGPYHLILTQHEILPINALIVQRLASVLRWFRTDE